MKLALKKVDDNDKETIMDGLILILASGLTTLAGIGMGTFALYVTISLLHKVMHAGSE